MLYQTDIVLNSPLRTDEIRTKILKLTKQSNAKGTEFQKFEGQLNETDFVIYPIFEYGPRHKFRPEIQGQLINANDSTQVNLKFGLSLSFKALFIFVLILNISFTVILFLFSFQFWWIVLIFLIIFFLMAQHSFNTKTSETIRILKFTLKAN